MKPLLPNEFIEGQSVWLLMTFRGKERAKHPATPERPNDIDNWVFEGYISRIDAETLEVKVTERTKRSFNLPTNVFSFYIYKKFRQVSYTIPDYKLFRNKNEALKYEIKREKDLIRAKEYYHTNPEYREKNKERSRKCRENPEYREKENEYNRLRYNEDAEYKERSKDKVRRYRQQPEVIEKRKEQNREYNRKRYATDPIFREKVKERVQEYSQIREASEKRKEYHREYDRKLRENPEVREKRIEYKRKLREDPEYRERENAKKRERYAKKIAEKKSAKK